MANDKRIIRNHGKIAEAIIANEAKYSVYSDQQLRDKTDEFKERLKNGETLDDLLIDAYSVVREAAFRILNLKAYKVQLIGSIILHQGDISEMRTGEGKTLTGLFAAYLNALPGEGVHVVTVNEYLSARDSEINGRVFSFLGITVGLNGRSLSKDAKRNAYAQDITYTTNSELGFDYLRDNMVYNLGQKVQRKLNYAIIDEADSILIDEARTPLIISGGSQNRVNLYKAADAFAKTLKEPEDAEIDLESKQVYLSEVGIKKAHKYFSIDNLFDVRNTEIFHLIMNALKANFTFKKEIEYTVQNDEIILIDQFTGRTMPGRAYSDGLQQALQAKEGVSVEEETTTMATITYQNFYRLYSKLAGMTGTAKTEEEEFLKIYNTRVIATPTNRPVVRRDEPDLTFATKSAKLKHLVDDIKEINATGRPILIGTTSVESSEQVARWLEKANLKFEMINAKNHHREAEIVEKAGQKGAITLATNMAGRGTDIKLTEETKAAGGLFVMGIERNEARRIDNQLRGRAGRQGDPGTSRFYISMEDELMVRFTAPKVRNMFLKLGDDHIKSKMFTRAITNAQKKLEGLNFDQRKNVLDYDNILSQQREAMYAQRDDILNQADLSVVLSRFQYTIAYELVDESSELIRGVRSISNELIIKKIDGIYVLPNAIKVDDLAGLHKEEIAKLIQEKMMEMYKAKTDGVPPNVLSEMERRTIIQCFDNYWTKHINLSQKLRSGIYLQQYAQNNPLHEYVEESVRLFNRMKVNIARDTIDRLNSSFISSGQQADEPTQTINVQAPPKQKVINITEKDIDEILTEWGIAKENFGRTAVEGRVAELKEEFKEEPEKLQKLLIQEKIVGGLMDKLDQVVRQQQEAIQNLTQEKIDAIVNDFGLQGKIFTGEDVKKAFEEKMNSSPKEMHQKIINDSQVLMMIAMEFANKQKAMAENAKTVVEEKGKKTTAKKSTAKKEPTKQEFVVKDSEGNIVKKIVTNDDGTINEDETEDTEQVQTKIKIG
ncbi:preprotein translocase subunit SecA [Spiroplasma clarkii]|uniref:Protein translocase subunit SecA n=1 Tax=Spiroplasma clarkii TaxID=2139 RepID=A0A1Y0KZ21_9MOLU|nr:preprotein translocase subunit SecA [Spiroplasma clarkii]ARU90977.1 preprotein translocase subunit SecA [Spiroplasma clarkii]ATX70419.1 preprotein translocase subunit SecA [Spiroplasma clarkii]